MELDRDQLISLVVQLREEVKHAHERIAELEQQLRKLSPDMRLEEEYSLKAEERRQNKQPPKRRKQQSQRRGRRTTQEKLDEADRIQIVCPDGFDVAQCKLHRQRPVWRIEEGRAVLVAYHIYRGRGWRLCEAPPLFQTRQPTATGASLRSSPGHPKLKMTHYPGEGCPHQSKQPTNVRRLLCQSVFGV